MTKKRFLYAAVGFLLMIFLGLIYGWSVFVAPLEEEFGWSRADTTLVFTISMITFCFGSILGGALNRSNDGRLLLFVVAILEFVGFYMCSKVTQINELYLYYGLICGFATGIGYNTVISMVTTWFQNSLGVISGILMMGYGLGAFILGSVVSAITEAIGWRQTFQILAFLFVGILLLSTFVLRKNREQMEASLEDNTKSYTPLEMLKSPIFLKTFLWGTLICSVGMIVISNASPFAVAFGASKIMAVIAVGCVSITNGVGRIISGILLDVIGKEKTMVLSTVCALLSTILLILGSQFSLLYLILIGYIFSSFSYSIIAPFSTVFAKTVFGQKYYTTNFSIFSSVGIPASMIGSYCIGVILTKTNSYFWCFVVDLIYAILACILCIKIVRTEKKVIAYTTT